MKPLPFILSVSEAQWHKKIPLSQSLAAPPRQVIYLLTGLRGQLFS